MTALSHDVTATDVTSGSTGSSDPAATPAAELEHRTDLDGPDGASQLTADAPVKPDSPRFSEFDIKPEIVDALADVGITTTFAIQELTLPVALKGADLIGQARTGTGKTLGFGVPLLNRLDLAPERGATAPQALVVAPTRELAVQVSGDLGAAGARLGARVLTIYGGRAYEPQVEALRRGVDVVVGTPGRLLDLAQQGHLQLGAVRILVLDEADEMLDLGFLPDIEKLMAMLPAQRQTMLFSATMPGPIVSLARSFLDHPIQIRAEGHDALPTTENVAQFAYRAHALDKVEVLARVLQARGRGLTMIFVRTKRTAAKVAEELESRGFAAGAVHGDLGQGAREQALRAFRAGKIDVLVATDVAARGLDVDDVTHVINYQCPEDEKTYVHRIGRTARAGRSGTAITLVDWDDLPKWKLICDLLGLPEHEPAETYSTSEHLFLELDIPSDVRGVLPRAQRTRAGLDAEAVEDLGGREPRGATSARGERSGRGDRSGPGDRSDRGVRPDRGERPGRNRSRTRGGSRSDTEAAGASAGGGATAGAAGPGSTGSTGSEDTSNRPARSRQRRRRRAGQPADGAAHPAD